jgi:hypothetical protein
MMAKTQATAGRPMPPVEILGSPEDPALYMALTPAREVADWMRKNILATDGALHNPDHAHLMDADLCFLWASSAYVKAGRGVLGQAEQVMFRAGGWQKARQEQQMREWFGRVPEFIITLAADYCMECTDTDFCALVEHELYHVAQSEDEFGAPAFTKDGYPRLAIRGHDVEEFFGVVRRYGMSPDVAKLVEAARRPAEVSHASIARACGTCLLRAA